jgi:hypothetical protein
MSWKNLKILAIVILLVMDSFFLFSLIKRTRSARYYDGALIDSALSVFRESSFYVDRKFLSSRKASIPVYSGAVDEDSLSTVSQTLSGAGYSMKNEPGGTRFIGERGEFFLGNDFSFFYFENDRIERPSAILSDGGYLRQETGAGVGRFRQTAEAFLKDHTLVSSAKGFGYEICYTDYYLSEDGCIVCVMQELDGRDTENRIYLLIVEDRVVAADGSFAIAAPDSKLSAETVGLMDILFSEKNYFDEEYKESGEVSRKNRILSSVGYSYAVYFDADGRFYYVPICTVTYQNGESRAYNYVTGKLYS